MAGQQAHFPEKPRKRKSNISIRGQISKINQPNHANLGWTNHLTWKMDPRAH